MKNFNSSHMNKFQITINKIGRKKEHGDQEKVIIYTILMEYYKKFQEDIKHEPKQFPHKEKKSLIQNPNYSLLEAIKTVTDRLDSELRISFFPKNI